MTAGALEQWLSKTQRKTTQNTADVLQICIFCCLHLECNHRTSFVFTNIYIYSNCKPGHLARLHFWAVIPSDSYPKIYILIYLNFQEYCFLLNIFQTVTVWKLWHMATKHINMIAQILVTSMNSWNSLLFSFLFIPTWIIMFVTLNKKKVTSSLLRNT